MIRIFGLLSIFAICMILAGGAGVFWLSLGDLEEAKKESGTALAKGLSFNVSAQLQQQQQTIQQLANSTEVISALELADTTLLKNTATKLQTFLPNVLKLRILLPNVNELDETEVPFMGYADLQMVQKTLTSSPIPVVQGQGENRHLAITAAVKKDEQVIGVILASLKFDFVKATLAKAPVGESFFQIKQAKVVLASNGEKSSQSGSANEVKISKSAWSIAYWTAESLGFSKITLMLGIIAGASLFMCLASFLAYYLITQLLKKDQTNVLQAVKDLMTGKGLGSYPVNLTEMKVIISTLVQFKRILDNKQNNGSQNDEAHPTEIDDDDMFHLDGIEENPKLSHRASLKKKK